MHRKSLFLLLPITKTNSGLGNLTDEIRTQLNGNGNLYECKPPTPLWGVLAALMLNSPLRECYKHPERKTSRRGYTRTASHHQHQPPAVQHPSEKHGNIMLEKHTRIHEDVHAQKNQTTLTTHTAAFPLKDSSFFPK